MSSSVVFLLIAVGLSVLGSAIVWLHGRPRRRRTSVDHFTRGLRALSAQDGRYEPPHGVVVRRVGDPAGAPAETVPRGDDAPALRPRRSPRPSPRPRPASPEREGTRPGP